MISKHKLVYNSTTPAQADSLAAFLHATNKLTSTTVSAKEGLDVNVINPLTVNLDGVYADPANNPPDTIGVIFHTRASSPTAAEQVQRTTAGAPSSDAVVAANVHGADAIAFNYGFNGTTWDRLLSTSGQLQVLAFGNVADDGVDAGNPVKIGGRAVSGALAAVSTAADRFDMIGDLYRRIYVNDTPNIAGSNAAVSIDATSGGVACFAAPLAGRRLAFLQNRGSDSVYLGFGTVTTSNGIEVPPGATFRELLGPDLALKGIAATAQDCRAMQVA